MTPPKLSPKEKEASLLRRKEYQKEYQKGIPIELKRIYYRKFLEKNPTKRQEYYFKRKKSQEGICKKQLWKNYKKPV